jgi:5-methylcytosine-specific restriction endonuclease McrA
LENKDDKNRRMRKKYRTSEKYRKQAYNAGRNRRARKMNAEGSHTQSDIDLIYSEQEGRCFYCGITLHEYEVDHMHPLSRGGSNNPDNLCCSCMTCNRSKADKTIPEWESIRGW